MLVTALLNTIYTLSKCDKCKCFSDLHTAVNSNAGAWREDAHTNGSAVIPQELQATEVIFSLRVVNTLGTWPKVSPVLPNICRAVTVRGVWYL